NRATPSAPSLSQTHCRAALLSAKSPVMTESGATRPNVSQGRNLCHEKLREDPRLAGPRASGNSFHTVGGLLPGPARRRPFLIGSSYGMRTLEQNVSLPAP